MAGGPYRWVRHPNYLGVALELFGVPLLFGAWRTALVFTALNGLLPIARFHLADVRPAIRARRRSPRHDIISHLLASVPYERVPRKAPKLPARQKPGKYQEREYPYRYIPEKF